MAANGTKKLPVKLPPLNLSSLNLPSLNQLLLSGVPSSGRPLSGIPSSGRPSSGRHTLKKLSTSRSSSRSRSRSNPRLGTPHQPLPSPHEYNPKNYVPNAKPNVPEIPLNELERRVRICEEILHIMIHIVQDPHPAPNYLNTFVYIPYIPKFKMLGHNSSVIAYLIKRANGSYYEAGMAAASINLKPDETNFLNKLPIQVELNSMPPGILNVEIITYETISKALFETRLQIHEYEKVPRNVLGARINFSQMPYTARP